MGDIVSTAASSAADGLRLHEGYSYLSEGTCLKFAAVTAFTRATVVATAGISLSEGTIDRNNKKNSMH